MMVGTVSMRSSAKSPSLTLAALSGVSMKALQDKIFEERKHLSSKIDGDRKLSSYKGSHQQQ